jgi:hypothetical protein
MQSTSTHAAKTVADSGDVVKTSAVPVVVNNEVNEIEVAVEVNVVSGMLASLAPSCRSNLRLRLRSSSMMLLSLMLLLLMTSRCCRRGRLHSGRRCWLRMLQPLSLSASSSLTALRNFVFYELTLSTVCG